MGCLPMKECAMFRTIAMYPNNDSKARVHPVDSFHHMFGLLDNEIQWGTKNSLTADGCHLDHKSGWRKHLCHSFNSVFLLLLLLLQGTRSVTWLWSFLQFMEPFRRVETDWIRVTCGRFWDLQVWTDAQHHLQLLLCDDTLQMRFHTQNWIDTTLTIHECERTI